MCIHIYTRFFFKHTYHIFIYIYIDIHLHTYTVLDTYIDCIDDSPHARFKGSSSMRQSLQPATLKNKKKHI